MSRADFRLPEDLKRATMADADSLGQDFSEYVRQTLLMRQAWRSALHAVKAGADPDAILDPVFVAEVFGRVAAELRAENESDPAEAGPRRSKKD